VLFLINDIVNTDAQIFPENETFCRTELLKQPKFLDRLFEILMLSGQNLNEAQSWDIRDNTLSILGQLFHVQPDLRAPYTQIITNHKLNLAKEVQTCQPDIRELYLQELFRVEDIENAGIAKEEEKKSE